MQRICHDETGKAKTIIIDAKTMRLNNCSERKFDDTTKELWQFDAGVIKCFSKKQAPIFLKKIGAWSFSLL
jgi:hypothetical protein